MTYEDAVEWVKSELLGTLDDNYPDIEDRCWVALVDGGMSEKVASMVINHSRWIIFDLDTIETKEYNVHQTTL